MQSVTDVTFLTLGAASLRYLSVEGLVAAVSSKAKPYASTTKHLPRHHQSAVPSSPAAPAVVSSAQHQDAATNDVKDGVTRVKISCENASPARPLDDDRLGTPENKDASFVEKVNVNGCAWPKGDVTKQGYCTACLTGVYPVSLDW
jgi:hypothetical protein